MFSLTKLKISTGLMTIFTFFFILIVFTTGYNVYTSDDAYDALVISNYNTDDARNLASINGDLTTALATLNRIAGGTTISDADINREFAKIQRSVESSRASLQKFLATPFSDKEFEILGNKIKEISEKNYQLLKDAEAEARANHSVSFSDARVQALNELDTISARYLELNRTQSALHEHEAKSSYTTSVVISIISLLAALILSSLTWLWMRRQLIMRLSLVNHHLEKIGNGNLAAEIDSGAANEIGDMILGLKSMQSNLVSLISQVRSGAENITVGAGEIASGNNDLSSRTEEQAAALQQTAASMEEIKMTVKQNADNANQANDLASSAKQLALEGGKAAESTRVIMDAIQESSKAIAEINSVITSIASQTNILALNAAVEAARAGEQGRGFAVVAGEVRSLAQRSSTAAQEIRSLIDQTTTKVASGVNLVMETNHKINNAIDSVTKVSDLMEEIKTAAEEQNVGIAQVSQAITEMDTVTQQNAALVEQAAAASASLNEQAQQLSNEVAFFHVKEDNDVVKSRKVTQPHIKNSVQVKKPLKSVHTPTVANNKDKEDNWEEF